jgi:hypothetical protein
MTVKTPFGLEVVGKTKTATWVHARRLQASRRFDDLQRCAIPTLKVVRKDPLRDRPEAELET